MEHNIISSSCYQVDGITGLMKYWCPSSLYRWVILS